MNQLTLIIVFSIFMSAIWEIIWKIVPSQFVEKLPSWVKSIVIAVLNLIGGLLIVFTAPSNNPIDLMLAFGFTSTVFTKVLTALMFVGGTEAIYQITSKISEAIKQKQ